MGDEPVGNEVSWETSGYLLIDLEGDLIDLWGGEARLEFL